MPIPVVYRTAGEPVVASYDYTDIAEGTGIQLFYAFVDEDSSGADDHLTGDSAVRSSDIDSEATTAAESFTLITDRDFDLSPFNLPKIIKGTAIITFPFASTGGGSGTAHLETYTIIKIRKYSGTTETEIASAQTPTLDGTGGSDIRTINMTIIIPQTHFKKGDILRMTVEVWGKFQSSGGSFDTAKYAIGHDPANRDGVFFTTAADYPTQMILRMPFKLDL